MTVRETVTQWIELLKDGDAGGAERIWQRYFDKVCSFARNKLPEFVKREFDEEDVALSAIDTLYRGIRLGKYPRLNDRNNLWSLLVVITARKVSHKLRDRSAQKRGGQYNIVSSSDNGEFDVVKTIIGKEPTPDFALQVAEEADRMLKMLPQDSTRRVAEMKMAGLNNEEIAKELECGLRTVERKLMLIRRIWGDR